ncbi:hypothetical protein CLMAG_05740 [Clostridium magnum DSM 2767]|uniref:Uncharacterized protein n=1 Tax=Clostridium magnum DSM 2767 TaxID=1121326 RepID=A0A161X233_9CLOT|nr:hypothetical protein CLMAG_05740 [Clostridium magnum DSM 2767]SHJ68752.1 hypothetical protein SAMN02745944_06332 [Clostridium magnum DSM 2767]
MNVELGRSWQNKESLKGIKMVFINNKNGKEKRFAYIRPDKCKAF